MFYPDRGRTGGQRLAQHSFKMHRLSGEKATKEKRGKDPFLGVQEKAEGREVPQKFLGLTMYILRATCHEHELVPR